MTLPREYREEHGPRYRFIRVGERLELIPVARDPLAALREEFSKIPSEESTEEVVERAESAMRGEATRDSGAGR